MKIYIYLQRFFGFILFRIPEPIGYKVIAVVVVEVGDLLVVVVCLSLVAFGVFLVGVGVFLVDVIVISQTLQTKPHSRVRNI